MRISYDPEVRAGARAGSTQYSGQVGFDCRSRLSNVQSWFRLRLHSLLPVPVAVGNRSYEVAISLVRCVDRIEKAGANVTPAFAVLLCLTQTAVAAVAVACASFPCPFPFDFLVNPDQRALLRT